MAEVEARARRAKTRVLLFEDFEGIAEHWLLSTSNLQESRRVAWQAYRGHAAFQLTTAATANDTASIRWGHPGPEGALIRVSVFLYIPYLPENADIMLQYVETTRTTQEQVTLKYNTVTHTWQMKGPGDSWITLDGITTKLPMRSWILLKVEFNRAQKRLTLVQINNERYRFNKEYYTAAAASNYTQAQTLVQIQTLVASKASIIIDDITVEEL